MQDLFENPEILPIEVQQIINHYSNKPNTYENCEKLLKAMQKLGYSFEYGLDAEPYDLHKITL